MSLSKRQQHILAFIRRFMREAGYPPTIREIGSALGISSTSVVNYHLRALQKQGLIERDPAVSRGLKLVSTVAATDTSELAVRSVPILGVIAAGAPIPIPDSDAVVDELDTLELTRDILSEDGPLYALEVRGDSMIDALVHDGDVVVLRHQNTAQNGDMVAIWLRDERETTLKHFYLEPGRVRLQPANPTMEPVYVHPSNVEVQGKVILVIRRLDG